MKPDFVGATFLKQGLAPSNDLNIFYQVFGEVKNPCLLLIMGLDAQCYLWSHTFIEQLVAQGYCVVRYDHRDIGQSTWLNNWSKSTPYTLEDMALDALAVLDHLNIKKAHIMGASMGGMIAQRLAISHAQRVLSLSTIMTTAWALDPSCFPKLRKRALVTFAPFLLKAFGPPKGFAMHRVSVARYVSTYKWLAGGKYIFDRTYFTELFNFLINERKGQNPKAMYQHFCAVVASGSRLHELKNITVPTLMFHGTADQLLPISHSRKMARLIKHAQFIELEGVGHELPKQIAPQVIELLLTHLKGKK
jgi:pimeloyl-ACP methyl ester carboxylesterase